MWMITSTNKTKIIRNSVLAMPSNSHDVEFPKFGVDFLKKGVDFFEKVNAKFSLGVNLVADHHFWCVLIIARTTLRNHTN